MGAEHCMLHQPAALVTGAAATRVVALVQNLICPMPTMPVLEGCVVGDALLHEEHKPVQLHGHLVQLKRPISAGHPSAILPDLPALHCEGDRPMHGAGLPAASAPHLYALCCHPPATF